MRDTFYGAKRRKRYHALYSSMTVVLDFLYFTFRYIPFWSIPIMIICMQFGYIFWSKEVRWVAKVFFSGAGVAFLFLVYYIIAGSPERSAQWLDDAVRGI